MFHAPRARMSCRRPLDLAVALLLTLAAYSEADQTYRGELAEADRRAWLNDWYSPLPLYRRAEEAARSARDERNVLYARFGRLRGQMQTLALPEAYEEIAKALDSPLARADAELRLRGLTVKGDIDLEWDLDAAQHDWSAVQRLAKELGHEGWENRANGELGMIAFLKGDTGGAGKLVEQALQVATKNGDVGGQLRYMSAIANGLLSAGYPQPALMFANKALDFARQHPETGFPYTVYSTKVLTHLRLGQADEAERFATTALREARTGDRRIKQIELLLMLAKIAQQRGQPVEALRFQEQAVKLARDGHVRRLLADAEHDLAEAYRRGGDLARALEHARASVIATQASGNRFNLPGRFEVLARLYAATGDAAAADRTYQQATDVVEGIMRHVPNAAAQARLISVMGELYVGHFVLAVEALRAPAKAYRIIEQARGRALADVLRTFGARADASPETIKQNRVISQLQVQLMRARQASTRRELLERISIAEQGPLDVGGLARPKVPAAHGRVDIRDVQKVLRPNEVLIEYVLAEPRSYCLVITHRTYASRRLSSQQSIKDLTDAYVKTLKSPRGEADAAVTALYAALVEPLSLPATASRLIVVPDGHLNLLPFDQLLADGSGAAQSVTLAPSASVFTLLRTPAASPVARHGRCWPLATCLTSESGSPLRRHVRQGLHSMT